jgi:hypothetical protein
MPQFLVEALKDPVIIAYLCIGIMATLVTFYVDRHYVPDREWRRMHRHD